MGYFPLWEKKPNQRSQIQDAFALLAFDTKYCIIILLWTIAFLHVNLCFASVSIHKKLPGELFIRGSGTPAPKFLIQKVWEEAWESACQTKIPGMLSVHRLKCISIKSTDNNIYSIHLEGISVSNERIRCYDTSYKAFIIISYLITMLVTNMI